MEPADQPIEPEAPAPAGKQRFKPSSLEILIGILIVLGFFYLGYLVLAKEGGDNRKLDNRIKLLENKLNQQGPTLEKDLQGIKAGLQQIETRLKTLEDQEKQLDAQFKQMQARTAAVPPKPVTEEKKPAPAPAGREKVSHKVKKGENIYGIAKKYRVSAQEVIQWNKLPANPTLKVGDSLIIYKR